MTNVMNKFKIIGTGKAVTDSQKTQKFQSLITSSQKLLGIDLST